MAVSTNLGLYLPTVDDFITVARDLTGNYEIIDAAVGANTLGITNLRSAFGFVEDGDVATHAIAAGQYLLWKGVLYVATAAISVGAAISGKVSAVTKGAVNDLRDKVVQLGSQTLTNTQKNQVKSNLGIGNMVGATSGTAGQAGFAPAPAAGKQGQFLRGDGTWNTPTNTTYSNFGGASSSAAGSSGLVPAPAKGYQGKFLRGDGTWQVPPDTNTWRPYQIRNYSHAYTCPAGSKVDMSASTLGISAVSGYVPAGVLRLVTGNPDVQIDSFQLQSLSESWAVRLHNYTDVQKTGTLYVTLLWLHTD